MENMRIVLVGGGGHASDVLGVFEDAMIAAGLDQHPVVGFVDDRDVDDYRFRRRGVSQIGTIDDLPRIDATHFLLASGWPRTRKLLLERVKKSSLQAASIVHPRALVPRSVPVGEGSVVLGGVCVSPLAVIGAHAYVSHGVLLGHDCRVADFVSVMPGAAVSGDTMLGEAAMIGTNATVIQGITVGARASVGAGAVVTKDVPPDTTVVGNPARPLSPKSTG